MESPSSRVNVPNSRKSSKRLLFDSRYGWVIDEWKEPSEEALEGGRGMFCVFPLAMALVKMVSQSIKLVEASARKASEKPQMLQGAMDDRVRNFMSSLKNSGHRGSILSEDSQPRASNGSSHSHTESNE